MSSSKKDKEAKAKAALGTIQIHQSRKQGYLTKLGGKGIKKNWRQRWFVLDDQNLYYFTDDTTTKVKGFVPLSDYSTVEVWPERKHAFKLYHKSNEEARKFFIQAASEDEMQDWMKLLQQGIDRANNIVLKYGPGVFRKERSLYIKIAEGRKLGAERDTYCTVSVDKVQRARTPTIWQSDMPMYLQEYDLDIEETAETVYIFMKEQKKKEKKTKESNVIGVVQIGLANLKESAAKPIEKYFDVKNPETNETVAELRMVLQYQEATVLPDSSYDELFHLLLVDHMALTKMFGAVSIKKEKIVADCLVKAFEMRKTGVHYVKEITATEINTTPDPNIIFRGNTVGTKSVDIYMRLVGLPYMHKVLKPIIEEIYKGKKSCEVDVQRLDKGKEKDVKKNVQTLLAYVKQIFESIQNSFLWCPASFRNIFEELKRRVKEKFPDDPVVQYTAPSGFIFLRFFCPALLGPKLFGLANEHPPTAIARDLTLIAKTLQNLANLVPFGKKEPYMADVNPFIEQNMPAMRAFIDKLCSAPKDPIDEIPGKIQINFGREMARIHYHLLASYDAMKEKYGENDEKLVKLRDIFAKLEVELQEIPQRIAAAGGNATALPQAPPVVLHQKRADSTTSDGQFDGQQLPQSAMQHDGQQLAQPAMQYDMMQPQQQQQQQQAPVSQYGHSSQYTPEQLMWLQQQGYVLDANGYCVDPRTMQSGMGGVTPQDAGVAGVYVPADAFLPSSSTYS